MDCECPIVKRLLKHLALMLLTISSVVMTGFGCTVLLHENCLVFRSLSPEYGGQSIGLSVALVFMIAFITCRMLFRRRGVGTMAKRVLMVSHPLIVAINLWAMRCLPIVCVACLVLATTSATVLVCLWGMLRFCHLHSGMKLCRWVVAVFLLFQSAFWVSIILQG